MELKASRNALERSQNLFTLLPYLSGNGYWLKREKMVFVLSAIPPVCLLCAKHYSGERGPVMGKDKHVSCSHGACLKQRLLFI